MREKQYTELTAENVDCYMDSLSMGSNAIHNMAKKALKGE